MLLKYNVGSYSFLLDFVISNESGFALHYLKLVGVNLVNRLKMKSRGLVRGDVRGLRDISDDKESPKIISKWVRNHVKVNRAPDEVGKFTYPCFGSNAVDRGNCENKFYQKQKGLAHVGVWDKKCESNNECPFYRANKNYPNEFITNLGERHSKSDMMVPIFKLNQ